MRFRLAVAAVIGGYLVVSGAYAVVRAAEGNTGGTDTSPGFGYVIGVPLLAVGLVLLGFVARAVRR